MWKALLPVRPSAQAIAGNHECRRDVDCSASGDAGSKRASTSQPNANAIVRHSNAGIVSVRRARAGHVAHSGMASKPMQVHVLGESDRHRLDGGLKIPNQTAALEVTRASTSAWQPN